MKQWKRLLSLVLVASLVFSMGIVLPEVQADSSSAPVETTWDFAENATGWTLEEGWTAENGTLVWRPGKSTTAGSYGTGHNQYGGKKALLSDTAATGWTNYAISADITAEHNNSANANTGASTNQYSMGGIAFFVNANDWIQIRVRPSNQNNRFGVSIYENSTASALFNSNVTVGTDSGTQKQPRTFNLKAEMAVDGKLTVYINDVMVAEVTVATPAGAPALYGWQSAQTATTQDTVTFDNVKVTPLSVPTVTPTPDYNGTLLGWSDGSADLGSDWTVTGSYTAENGVLKATTASNFFAKVGTAVQHGYIEADVTLPAKSDFTATSNKALGYVKAIVGTNQVYTLRLFWQQASKSTTLHDGTLYADLFIDDSPAGTDKNETNHHYGGAAESTRVSYTMADANWGKTYTLRLARIGNFIEAKLIDKETSAVLKTWQYALNPAYTIVTGAMTLGFGADVKDSGCNVTIDNVVAASIAANAVSVGELDLQIDAYSEITKGLDDAAQKIDAFYRTAFAPGETVTVKLKNAADWDVETLRYITATNTAGTKLVATADDKVYTFVMPAEAVTLAGESATGEVIVPAYELLYDMAATPDANSTTGWRANATTVAGKGVCVKPATDLSGITNYYNTGVVNGWIKADIKLPTISEDALKTNAANTGDIWYGLGMVRGEGSNIESTKTIEAAIWYQRNTGTTEAAPKMGRSYLRIRFSGTGYDAANLLEVSLPNTLWTTGATVSMEMSKVGNYILVKVSCDTIPEANQIASCTVDFNTLAGGKDGTWKFGLKADNPLLYTDWTKTEEVAAEAYFNNVEIGNILRTVSVNIDSTAAGKVSLPEVNEFKGAALARDAYEVGEVLKLTVADDADLTYLHYTIDENSERVDITAPDAFVVPDAETVNIAYGKKEVPSNELLYDMAATPDANSTTGWRANATTVAGKGICVKPATDLSGLTNYYNTGVVSGWIKADITLPTISEDALKTNAANTGDIWYGLGMARGEGGNIESTKTIEAAIWYQRNTGTTEAAPKMGKSYLRIRFSGTGYDAANLLEISLPNTLWTTGATVSMEMRKVGNYILVKVSCDTIPEANQIASCTVDFNTLAGGKDGTWKFGLKADNPLLYTDWTKTEEVAAEAYFNNVEIGNILRTVSVNIDSTAAGKVSLPEVNEFKGAALARDAYEVGEVLELTVADGADAANLKYTTATNTDGVAIADANAFQIPNEDAITVVYQETPVVPEPGDELHSATYTGGALDADLWSAGGTVTADANGISGTTAMSVRYPEKFANGYMEAEFAITGDISNNALIFVRSPKNETLTGQNQEIVLRWTVSGTTATPQIVLRDYAGLGGYELAYTNALHGKPNKVTLTPDPVTGVMTLKVKVEVLGNLIRVYTNDTLNMEATLNPAFAVGYQEGYFGAALTADADVTITKMTVQEVKTYSVTGTENLITDEITHMVEPQLRQPSFSRTQYAAGELVSVTVKDAGALDLSTLRYTTATNADGVNLTATAVPNIFTFVMPEENVTLVCDEKTVTAPSTVVATIDGTALDTNIWAVTGNPVVGNGVITSDGTNTVLTKVAYQHASITAEITLPATHSLTANATVAAVVARINLNQEHVARFQWANAAGNLQLGMLVRDEVNTSNTTTNPHYGGGAHGVSRGNTHNDAWGKTYVVEVIRLGNLVKVTFTDKATDAVVESWTYNLNPAYEVTTTPMYFGFTTGMAGVVIDNVVVTSYDVHTVSAGELSVTLDKTAEIANGLDGSGLQHFDRTHYAADELVTVMVSDTTGLDLTTLRYTTATNTAGTALTATAVPGIYTFVMPQEDVTLVCDALIVTEPSEVIATVDGASNLDTDLWTVTGAYTADGTIGTTANNFKAVLDGTYQHFAIESEITVPAKPADLSANITFASLVATVGTKQAYTVRFFWQGGSNQTFYFDLFVDDSVNGTTYDSGKNNYGGAANGGRIGTALTDSHWDKTYVVTMSRIGNYLYVKAMDKETSNVVAELAYNLNPDYTIVKNPVTISFSADGSKGEVAFDNLKVTSYNTVSVSKGELDVSLDARREYAKGLEVDAKIDTFDRTAYVAGETVTVKVNDPSQLDLSTIRYVSASHLEGVLLTATGDPTVFTFVMPNENVTLVCDEGTGIPIVPRPEGEVFKENFDSFADGTASGTALKDLSIISGGGNAAVLNSALKIQGAFSAATTTTHRHGYIQADICLESAQESLANATAAVTKYGGNMSAKWNSAAGALTEVRTRFMIKRDPAAVQEYTVQLQLIVYSSADYGGAPVTHGYDISSSFQWGNTYNVKLEVIGNMIRVYLDGVVILTDAIEGDGALAAYEGKFGLAHTADSFAITVDNLDMHEHKAYAVSYDANMEGILKTDAYIIYQSGKLAIRTHFLENEFVRLNVTAPAGFGIDDATIKYTGTQCGEVAITAKDSAVLYGFRMPAEDVVVFASLTVAEVDTKPVADNFDVESLMRDRGWSNEKKILDGAARFFGSTESYLVGIAGSDTWSSYTASAKIAFLGNTSTGTGAAALCAKTASTAGGYEFGIEMSAGSKLGRIRLYDRSTSTMLYIDETSTIEMGKTYELTMVVTGNRITCYVDGVWKCSVTVSESVGGIGIRTMVASASFDDVKVSNIATK